MDNAVIRKRLEVQGFRDLDEETLAKVGPWMSFPYYLCTLGVIAGTVLVSPPVLWAMAVIAALAVILPFHPFDLLFNYGVRFLVGKRPFPPQTMQRRFACGVGAVWLVGTGYAFAVGALTTGYVLAIALIAVAGLVSTTQICIPSMIYNLLFRRGNQGA